MVECHVSGKVFVKKLETLLTSTLDQYTCVETDYKQSPEDETVSGGLFFICLTPSQAYSRMNFISIL